MDSTVFCGFIFVLLIFTPGASTLTLIPSANPVAAGGNITLTASPVMVISTGTWLFNNNILVFWYPGNVSVDGRYAGRVSFDLSTLQLSLHTVQVNDSGSYALQGMNPQVRAEVSLSVQEPIKNVSLTASKSNLVEFNDSVTLTCSANGTPLKISWFNGSAEVTTGVNTQISSNGSLFTISSVTRYDRGPFICVVANGISNGTSGSVYLNISYGPSNPVMTVLPEKMGYISGSNITLSCSADSSPPALFQWSYNGLSLNKAGQTLELLKASQNKTGDYTCTAFNTLTLRYTSATKSIRIIDPVSAAVQVPAGDVPIINKSFTLTCEVTGTTDSIYWMKDGLYLFSDSKVSLSNQNRTLSFSQLALSDDGKYQCVVSNAVSNMTSAAYLLRVNYGPWNTTISGPVVGVTGSSVTLTCSASSQPPSDYSWYFNGSKVAAGSVYNTGSLSLNSSGEYTCTAYNNITGNNSTAVWNLTVIVGISSVVMTPNVSIPLASQNFQLLCNVMGIYNSIMWLKHNRTFSPTTTATISPDNTTLSFQPLQITDDGVYQCVAINIIGKHVSKPYTLTANYGPVDLTITATKEIMLTCEAKSQPPSMYRWIVNNDTDAGEGPKISVPLITPLGTNYTCVARNPLTNVTLSGTYIISDNNTATPLQANAVLFLVLVISVLTLWL